MSKKILKGAPCEIPLNIPKEIDKKVLGGIFEESPGT